MPYIWETLAVMRLLLAPVLPCSSGTGQRGLLKGSTGGWWTVLSGLWYLETRAQIVPFGIILRLLYPGVGVLGP